MTTKNVNVKVPKKDPLRLIKTKAYNELEEYLTAANLPRKTLDETFKWACYEGDEQAVEILLTHGADVNYHDEFGTSMLHFAVRGEKESIVNILIRHKARYERWDHEGISLLHWSCQRGYLQIFSMLIDEQDEDVEAEDQLGRRCLHLACMHGQVEIVRYILNSKKTQVSE